VGQLWLTLDSHDSVPYPDSHTLSLFFLPHLLAHAAREDSSIAERSRGRSLMKPKVAPKAIPLETPSHVGQTINQIIDGLARGTCRS
jgi:hypothetical protein